MSPCALLNNYGLNISALQLQKPPVNHTVTSLLICSVGDVWDCAGGQFYVCLFLTNCCCRCARYKINQFLSGDTEQTVSCWKSDRHSFIGFAVKQFEYMLTRGVCFTHRPPLSVWLSPRFLCCPQGWQGPAAVWPWQRASALSECNVKTSGSAPLLQTPAG